MTKIILGKFLNANIIFIQFQDEVFFPWNTGKIKPCLRTAGSCVDWWSRGPKSVRGSVSSTQVAPSSMCSLLGSPYPIIFTGRKQILEGGIWAPLLLSLDEPASLHNRFLQHQLEQSGSQLTQAWGSLRATPVWRFLLPACSQPAVEKKVGAGKEN